MELLEKLAALIPLPHVHLVRYGGCLAPHSHLRGSVIPTPRQQGLEAQEAAITSAHWGWAQLLHRAFALDMVHCPWCQRGTLRLIAVITQGEVIRKILRHQKRSVDPPPSSRPAPAKHRSIGWPKPTPTRMVSWARACCDGMVHTAARVHHPVDQRLSQSAITPDHPCGARSPLPLRLARTNPRGATLYSAWP